MVGALQLLLAAEVEDFLFRSSMKYSQPACSPTAGTRVPRIGTVLFERAAAIIERRLRIVKSDPSKMSLGGNQ